MSTADWIHKMTEAGISTEQAIAIASMPEERYVTRDYLDARISKLLNDITWRMVGLAVIVLAGVTALDKWVRP